MKPLDYSLLWTLFTEVLCGRLAGRHFVHRNVTSVLQYLRELRVLHSSSSSFQSLILCTNPLPNTVFFIRIMMSSSRRQTRYYRHSDNLWTIGHGSHTFIPSHRRQHFAVGTFSFCFSLPLFVGQEFCPEHTEYAR